MVAAELPNTEGKVVLKLFPDDFDSARDAVARIQEDMTDQAASIPPPHPPLRSLFDESDNDSRELDQ